MLIDALVGKQATHAPILSTTATVTVTATVILPGTPQCKSLQLQASIVPIAIYSNISVARNLFVYTRAASNVNTTLTYQIAIWAGIKSECQHRATPSITCSRIIRIYWCMSYNKLSLIPRFSYHGRKRNTGRQNMRGQPRLSLSLREPGDKVN